MDKIVRQNTQKLLDVTILSYRDCVGPEMRADFVLNYLSLFFFNFCLPASFRDANVFANVLIFIYVLSDFVVTNTCVRSNRGWLAPA